VASGTANAWTERAVNTTVACAAIGCTANATLQAFDATREEAWNCRLNIGVHATDYDDDWSRENIDFWTVNGYIVRAHCDPMARGCNSSASRPLYSCLNDFQVDHIVGPTGAFQLQGTLSRMVDECPYEGNLLSSVAQVTCLVRTRPELLSTSTTTTTTPPPLLSEAMILASRYVSAPLACSSPGCGALAELRVDPAVAYVGGTCLMNVSIAQTDFDGSEGGTEFIEYLEIVGRGNISNRTFPGGNPCQRPGEPRQPFRLATQIDVTQDVVRESPLRVSAKISEMVDECASRGLLLDGLVEVGCTPPAELAR